MIKIAEIKAGISAQTKFTTQTFDDAVRVRAGDLLFSWSGQPETSIDAYRWRGPEGWLNQHVFRVTPVDVDTAFFHYLLRYLNPHFVAIAKNKQTTGLGHVTRRDLENMRVAVPPLSEQRAIGHVLGTLDDKIDLNRSMNATLEGMVRALFKSWFVDFEPVRAKMAGRDTGLPTPIDDLFPERIVGIGNRQVPKGWRNGTVHDVASLNPESWSAKRRPTELSYVDLANTKWGYIESAATFPLGKSAKPRPAGSPQTRHDHGYRAAGKWRVCAGRRRWSDRQHRLRSVAPARGSRPRTGLVRRHFCGQPCPLVAARRRQRLSRRPTRRGGSDAGGTSGFRNQSGVLQPGRSAAG